MNVISFVRVCVCKISQQYRAENNGMYRLTSWLEINCDNDINMVQKISLWFFIRVFAFRILLIDLEVVESCVNDDKRWKALQECTIQIPIHRYQIDFFGLAGICQPFPMIIWLLFWHPDYWIYVFYISSSFR